MTDLQKLDYCNQEKIALEFIKNEHIDTVHFVIIKLLCIIIDILIS